MHACYFCLILCSRRELMIALSMICGCCLLVERQYTQLSITLSYMFIVRRPGKAQGYPCSGANQVRPVQATTARICSITTAPEVCLRTWTRLRRTRPIGPRYHPYPPPNQWLLYEISNLSGGMTTYCAYPYAPAATTFCL